MRVIKPWKSLLRAVGWICWIPFEKKDERHEELMEGFWEDLQRWGEPR